MWTVAAAVDYAALDGGGLRQFIMFRERRQAWEKEILRQKRMTGWSRVCACYEGSVWTLELGRVFSETNTQRLCRSSGIRRKPLGRGCEAERWSALVSGCGRHSGEACMSSETPDYKL